MIWLWGQGQRPKMQKFSDLFGISGAVVASQEYAKGVARLAGLTVLESGTQWGEETDYEKIGKLFLEAISEKDFVCVHVKDCEEAARVGDLKAKISALEAADFFVLSRVKEALDRIKDIRVLVTPCHATPWMMRRHVRDSVPFVVTGKNIMADDIERFSEAAAKVSELKINKSTDLMPLLVAK